MEEYDLELIDRYDARDKQTRKVCETEAMPQAILMQLVRDELDDLLPDDFDFDIAEEEEERERTVIRNKLTRMRKSK